MKREASGFDDFLSTHVSAANQLLAPDRGSPFNSGKGAFVVPRCQGFSPFDSTRVRQSCGQRSCPLRSAACTCRSECRR